MNQDKPDQPGASSEIRTFFELLFGDRSGQLCISRIHIRDGTKVVVDENYEYPAVVVGGGLDSIIETWNGRVDLYFRAALFDSSGKHTKANITVAPFSYADVDGLDPQELKPEPSALTETSPGHYHAFWPYEDDVEPGVVEDVNIRIAAAYKEGGVDPSGADLTQMLRIPGTINLKDDYDRPQVAIHRMRKVWFRVGDFAHHPKVDPTVGGASTNGDGLPELPDFEPLPLRSKETEYFWSFFEKVRGEQANPGAKGPHGEDRGRSGRTHWFEDRCAEMGLTPGQIRLAVHDYAPAKSKDDEQPGWIDHDFRYWLRDEWPKFADAKFNKEVSEHAYRRRVQRAADRLVDAEDQAAAFSAPDISNTNLKGRLENGSGRPIDLSY